MMLSRLLQFQQHLAKQFASRQDDPRGDIVLISAVFVLGGRTMNTSTIFLGVRPRIEV
jgi:hypothetical protein